MSTSFRLHIGLLVYLGCFSPGHPAPGIVACLAPARCACGCDPARARVHGRLCLPCICFTVDGPGVTSAA
eukprot:5411929-Pleurochrysis_carterae.AAC.1